MTNDNKACQEAFEQWGKEIGISLEKNDFLNCDNPFDNKTAWLLYKGWKEAWRNRTEALSK
jgi:hypothetical protein